MATTAADAISTSVKYECRDRFLFAMLIDRGSILVFPVSTSSRGIEHNKKVRNQGEIQPQMI
jgi:hypothetical protein